MIEHGGFLGAFSFAHPIRVSGLVSACLGDIPPDMPRRPETWVSL